MNTEETVQFRVMPQSLGGELTLSEYQALSAYYHGIFRASNHQGVRKLMGAMHKTIKALYYNDPILTNNRKG